MQSLGASPHTRNAQMRTWEGMGIFLTGECVSAAHLQSTCSFILPIHGSNLIPGPGKLTILVRLLLGKLDRNPVANFVRPRKYIPVTVFLVPALGCLHVLMWLQTFVHTAGTKLVLSIVLNSDWLINRGCQKGSFPWRTTKKSK